MMTRVLIFRSLMALLYPYVLFSKKWLILHSLSRQNYGKDTRGVQNAISPGEQDSRLIAPILTSLSRSLVSDQCRRLSRPQLQSEKWLDSRRIRGTPAPPFLATASLTTQLRMNSGVTCVKPLPPIGMFRGGWFLGTLPIKGTQPSSGSRG